MGESGADGATGARLPREEVRDLPIGQRQHTRRANMGIVGLLISRGVRFMADGLNGPTNEEARKLLEIRLEEAQARHAEDLERLGREMSEFVARPLQARLDVARRVERDVRTALCASMSECTDVAARRVAGERDLARAERDRLSQACENWSKLDAPLSEFRRVLRVGDYESTLDAARRMSRELEVCLGQLDHVMAREKSIQLEAYALGRKSAEEQEAEWESERKELVAARDETYGNMKALRDRHVEAYAALGAKIGERLDVAARRVVAERDAARAIRDEAIARAEKAEAELEAARASASLVTMVGDIGVRNSGDATRLEAILAERDRLSQAREYWQKLDAPLSEFRRVLRVGDHESTIDAARRMYEEVATLRARVAVLEHEDGRMERVISTTAPSAVRADPEYVATADLDELDRLHASLPTLTISAPVGDRVESGDLGAAKKGGG